jgi:carboxylesterase
MTTAIMPGCEPFSVNNGPLGVLVLHGFTGNPTSMRPIAERLAKAGYSVFLPRLPGHGTSVEDMMTTSWADWSRAALDAYDELAKRSTSVAVVGLSMGGGLSAFVAEQRHDVAACVFINPLVKPPAQELIDGLQALLDSGMETFESIGSDIKKEGTVEASYSATPLGCAASLFDGVTGVERDLGKIVAPSLLLSSREDHVVTSDNGDAIVAKSSGTVERIWLENSYHVATIDNDQELVESSTLRFLDAILHS